MYGWAVHTNDVHTTAGLRPKFLLLFPTTLCYQFVASGSCRSDVVGWEQKLSSLGFNGLILPQHSTLTQSKLTAETQTRQILKDLKDDRHIDTKPKQIEPKDEDDK